MNKTIDTNNYAIQQNNIGVNCYRTSGDIDGALHYFRRAVSAKLASEQRLLAITTEEEEEEASDAKTLHKLDSLYHMEVTAIADKELQQERCVTPESRCSDQWEVYATGGVTGKSIQSFDFFLVMLF